ncbi:hypothetical protein PFICI_05406 [Pestalotiopsis fici W106-1]|uniref:Uncharacterized protein n=1 Tax=Pestalotiopsis fici (strain W106-1 / CGMCC3.15140) TaxID=1229662 RepID=W3XBV6_PESFW|nr:uncharacterized protein PFICI_05406 [Pestalotiopsis fici W106-1]ETS83530.1 hypothetical protein PFICI_05406 [Pestalotiopsis fici W106-1]
MAEQKASLKLSGRSKPDIQASSPGSDQPSLQDWAEVALIAIGSPKSAPYSLRLELCMLSESPKSGLLSPVEDREDKQGDDDLSSHLDSALNQTASRQALD